MKDLFPDNFRAAIAQLTLQVSGVARGQSATGAHRSRAAGASLDFRDFYPYTAGDDLRRVDWNVYQRTGGHLFLRRFDQLAPSNVHLLVDDSPSMFIETPARYAAAARIAAAVASAALRSGDPVALTRFSDSTRSPQRPFSHRRQFPQLLVNLSKPPASINGSLKDAVETLLRQGSIPEVAVILSDFFHVDGLEPILSALRRLPCALVLVQLVQSWDAEPDSELIEYVDCETGQVVKTTVSSDKKAYRQAYARYTAELSRFGAGRMANLLRVDAASPLFPQLAALFPGGVLRLASAGGTR